MKRIIRKPSRYELKQTAFRWLLIVLGNAVTAAASSFFIIPGGLVVGGTTGLGIFVEQLWHYEYARVITVYTANIALFILGAILLGRRFFFATLAGTFLYPAFLSLFDAANAAYVAAVGETLSGGDAFLDAFFGSLLFGAGIGLVVRVGASTGGTDIPPLLLQHFFGIPVSISLWVLDFAIVVLQLFAGSTLQTVLYGIVICVLSSVVIEFVTPLGRRKMQVKIVSHHYPEIREMILRSSTAASPCCTARRGTCAKSAMFFSPSSRRASSCASKTRCRRSTPRPSSPSPSSPRCAGAGSAVRASISPKRRRAWASWKRRRRNRPHRLKERLLQRNRNKAIPTRT